MVSPRPPPALKTGARIDKILLVVEPAPTVVLCDKTIGLTACRINVPVAITEDVPLVLPDISAAESTAGVVAA